MSDRPVSNTVEPSGGDDVTKVAVGPTFDEPPAVAFDDGHHRYELYGSSAAALRTCWPQDS